MSLFKGKLFNGKLFNGLLFGQLDQELCCNRRVGGDDAWHKARRKYQKRKKVFEDALEATIRQAYAKLRGDVPEAVVVAVKPFVETSHDTTTPPVYAVDWAAFVKDFERATIIWDMQISLRNESLLAAVERRIDEEEALLLLM